MLVKAMLTSANVLAASGGLLALASLPEGRQPLRAALIAVGLAGLGWAVMLHRGILVAAGFGMLLAVNLLRLALHLPRRARVRFLPEEAELAARGFGALAPAALRQLLDQGLWVHGQPGEALLKEGEPVGHLFWLSEGEVTIASNGRELARSGPGHFFGEIDIFSGTPAIATIRLSTPALFWCVAGDALQRFLAANPDFRPAIEMALAGELREKLRARNAQLVGLQTAAGSA